jgi:hypothetical protein
MKALLFSVPDWEDIVDSGIGLSYRLGRLHKLAGRYDNPVPKSTISPIGDYEFGLWMQD